MPAAQPPPWADPPEVTERIRRAVQSPECLEQRHERGADGESPLLPATRRLLLQRGWADPRTVRVDEIADPTVRAMIKAREKEET